MTYITGHFRHNLPSRSLDQYNSTLNQSLTDMDKVECYRNKNNTKTEQQFTLCANTNELKPASKTNGILNQVSVHLIQIDPITYLAMRYASWPGN